ncbi:MAG: lysylphosphatidylglycerol synthase transmembrane domain-containing protein [Candidatus Woesearchaeota archaeon]
MDRKLAVALSFIIGVAAAAIIFTKVGLGQALNTIWNAPLLAVIAYAAITFGIMALLVWRWRVIIKTQESHVPTFWQLFRYHLIGYAISYVTPGAKMGGEPVRAALLSRHKESFKEAGSTVFVDKSVELTTSATFFAVGAAVLLLAHAMPTQAQELMIIMAVVLLVLIGFFYYLMFTGKDFLSQLFSLTMLHKTRVGKKWVKHIKEFEQHILDFYRKDPKHFLSTVGISSLSWALMFVEYALIMVILGIPQPSVLELFLVITFIGAAYIIPLPMALGTLEAGQVSVFRMIGLPAAAGVGVAVVTRLKDIVLTVIGFACASYYGLHLGKDLKTILPINEKRK